KAFFRTHSFSNFTLFSVGAGQKLGAPKESYTFTNLTDQDVRGQLTITPVAGLSLPPLSITFTIPPRQSVFKAVGPGKDLNISAVRVFRRACSGGGRRGALQRKHSRGGSRRARGGGAVEFVAALARRLQRSSFFGKPIRMPEESRCRPHEQHDLASMRRFGRF